jgi:hypothetical protein
MRDQLLLKAEKFGGLSNININLNGEKKIFKMENNLFVLNKNLNLMRFMPLNQIEINKGKNIVN